MSCEDIKVSHEDLQWHHAVTWLTCGFVSGRLGEGGRASPVDPGHLGDQFVALALGPAAHGVQGGQVDDGLQAGAHDRRELVGGQGLGLDGLAHVVPAPVRRLLRCGRQGVLGDLLGCPAVSRSAARRRARRRTWRRPRRPRRPGPGRSGPGPRCSAPPWARSGGPGARPRRTSRRPTRTRRCSDRDAVLRGHPGDHRHHARGLHPDLHGPGLALVQGPAVPAGRGAHPGPETRGGAADEHRTSSGTSPEMSVRDHSASPDKSAVSSGGGGRARC
jgi:hypothetical protein